MNLLLHHLKKDFRHLRWLVALWVIIVLAEVFLIGFGSRAEPDDTAAQVAYQIVSMLLPILQYLLLLVMVPLLIQDEPQVGTTAFWVTRPIPRGLLCRSKALFIGALLVLFPVLAELAVIAANGVPTREVAGVAPEILFEGLGAVIPLVALAVLTVNFARFAIVGVSLLVVTVVVSVVVTISRLFLGGPEMWAEQSTTLAMSRSLVSGLLMIVFGSAVVVNQYGTRRTPVSLGMGLAGVLLTMGAGSFWPWNFMRLPDEPPPASVVDCQALSVTVNDRFVHVSAHHASRRVKEPLQEVSAGLEIEGLPPTYDTRVTGVRTRFTVAGQDPVQTTNRNTFYMGRDCWSREVLADLFPGQRVVGRSRSRSRTEDLVILSATRHLEFANTPGRLEGDVDLLVERLQTGHVFPLQKGSRYREGSTEEVLGEVRKAPGGVLVVLRRTALERRYVRQPEHGVAGLEEQLGKSVLYVLHNRTRGEVVMPDLDNNFAFDVAESTRRLKVKPLFLRYPDDEVDTDERMELDDAWLADAELVRITRTRAGTCTVKMEDADFSLAERMGYSKKQADEHAAPATSAPPASASAP